MKLVAAKDLQDGVELSYFDPDFSEQRYSGADPCPPDDPADMVFTYVLRRVCIGVSFPDAGDASRAVGFGFACVVGERVFYPRDRTKIPEALYVVLDEAERIQIHQLFDDVLKFKDKYLAGTVFAPPEPQAMVQSLRRHEGISWYNDGRTPYECRDIWPSFVSKECIAAVREEKTSESSMHRDIEALRTARALDPDSGKPILDTDFKPMEKLVLPNGFNNHRTQSGLSGAVTEVCHALWQAAANMNLTAPRNPVSMEDSHVHKPNPITGY